MMAKRTSLTIFGIIFLTALPAFGSTPTAMEIVQHVQDKYHTIQDATIKFTQTVVYPLSKLSKTVKGTLYLKKGNMYRIDTEDKVFVTNGKTSWVYLPSSQQVLIDNFRNDKNTITPDKFLLNIPSDYFAVLLSTKKGQGGNIYTLRLTPKSDNSFIRSIRVVVDTGWTVQSAEVSDMNDTRYTYTVDSLRTNTGLPDSEFEFVPPKGAQVVDLRQR